MKDAVIYIHGKGGSAEEAVRYRSLFADCDVIGFDYRAQTPWEAQREFTDYFDSAAAQYQSVTVIANSIGAFFTMCALSGKSIRRAFFISPIVDMERLIIDMMKWAGVTEEELRSKGEISTDFGETLSWEYLCWVREHPVSWQTPTYILYGGKDDLTPRTVITDFARRIGAELTVMEDGEHWFHTDGQMRSLEGWLSENI